jgi:hypothetical protein
MEYQLSGEVNDETAQSIGQKLGAQTIISGSITALGDIYRLRVQALSVETARIQGMQNIDVIPDSRLSILTGVSHSASLFPIENNISGSVPFSLLANMNGLKVITDEERGGRSTGRTSINKEIIDGEERTVINMTVTTVNSKLQYSYAQIHIVDKDFMEKAKNASGIRFKIYGDGKKWYFEVATPGINIDYAFYRMEFTARRNRITTIDIPYTRLQQTVYGNSKIFNKHSICQLKFGRDGVYGLGTSSIKIFDLEIY